MKKHETYVKQNKIEQERNRKKTSKSKLQEKKNIKHTKHEGEKNNNNNSVKKKKT